MPKTKRVKLTVAMNAKGEYAVGAQNEANAVIAGEDEESSLDFYHSSEYEGNPTMFVITAELPIPDPVEVEGRVE